MAALDFPASPVTNDTYTANGTTWTFDGVAWRSSGSGGGSSTPTAVRVVTGTTDTLLSTDNGNIVIYTSSSAITTTLPNNLVAGFSTLIVQEGTGQVTLTAGSGATRVSRLGFTKTAGQNASLSVVITTNAGGASAKYNVAGDGA